MQIVIHIVLQFVQQNVLQIVLHILSKFMLIDTMVKLCFEKLLREQNPLKLDS